MNYLAHLYLSGDAEKLMIGNFIADGVKGAALNNYDPEIKRGIQLHRKIDQFTDHCSLVRDSHKLIYPIFHKYAGVVTDVFFDHFLAVYWLQFHHTDLYQYSQQVYRLMQNNYDLMPLKTKALLPYMIKGNWLYNYSTIAGVDRALKGLSRRTPFVSGMEHAGKELEENYGVYTENFMVFFPLLQDYVRSLILEK